MFCLLYCTSWEILNTNYFNSYALIHRVNENSLLSLYMVPSSFPRAILWFVSYLVTGHVSLEFVNLLFFINDIFCDVLSFLYRYIMHYILRPIQVNASSLRWNLFMLSNFKLIKLISFYLWLSSGNRHLQNFLSCK